MITQTILSRHILVADGDFESRLAVSAALSGNSYSVDTVSNGLAAYTKVSDNPPDLLMIAPQLGGIDSIELCRLVRECSQLPVVFYSGPEEIAYKLEAFDAGADDFIVKRTEFEEILARLRAVFRRCEPAEKDKFVEEERPTVESKLRDVPELSAAQDGYRLGIREAGSRLASKLTLRYRKRPRDYAVVTGTPVLVADADNEARQHTCRLLKTLNYFPMESDSGVQTLLTIKKYRPQLVLVELAMPDLNGLELINVLKTHPNTREMKVIVVSGRGDPDTVQAARELGVEDYIVKPWAADEFEIRVRWALEPAERRAVG